MSKNPVKALMSSLSLRIAFTILTLLVSGCSRSLSDDSAKHSQAIPKNHVANSKTFLVGKYILIIDKSEGSNNNVIVFKNDGREVFSSTLSADEVSVAYQKPKSASAVSAPDIILEGRSNSGDVKALLFKCEDKISLVNSVQTMIEQRKYDVENGDSVFFMHLKDRYEELGGANPVEVPFKLSWCASGLKFVEKENYAPAPSAERLAEQANTFSPLFWNCDDSSVLALAPPELSEEIAKLFYEGHADKARRLLALSWPSGHSGKEKYWRFVSALFRKRLVTLHRPLSETVLNTCISN